MPEYVCMYVGRCACMYALHVCMYVCIPVYVCTDVRMHNTPPHMYKGVHRYVYIPQHRPESLNRPRILQQSCEDDISIGSEFSRNLQPQIAAAVHGRSRKKLAESNQESLAWLLWVRGTMRSTRQS